MYLFYYFFQLVHQTDILKCLSKGLSGPQYPESVRSFALALHYYSPKAYRFVRQTFDNHLPCPSTITKWYINSNANGDPGISKQSLETLRKLAKEERDKGKQLVCALIYDEMAIRKHMQWSDSQKKFLGHITYGLESQKDELQLATNAIVFMVNGIDLSFSIPFAFFFITTLSGHEKATLLKEIISAITGCDVRITSVTFDGLISNLTMCNLLGASFDPYDFKPYFKLDNQKIHIILDPSHMIKLARNCVANNKLLLDHSNSEIRWELFVHLEKFREKGLSHTHKLNRKHIEWFNNKMNVQTAVETLSNSVADSMQFLMNQGYPEFSNATATIEYTRCMNNIFDIMNTKNTNSDNIFKQAITPSNEEKVFAYFDYASRYIQKLKLSNGKTIIDSAKRCAFRGLITNMVNFESIYRECIESNTVENLKTFAFSQDHVESFFGRIRARNGSNDNPTTQQFCAAFRKVLVNKEISSSEYSNCKDYLNILTVSSRNPEHRTVQSEQNENSPLVDEQLSGVELVHIECDLECDDLEKSSISFVAASIENKITTEAHFSCNDCLGVFSENEKVNAVLATKIGRSQLPCVTTYNICKISNKYLKILAADASYTYEKLICDISHEVDSGNAFPDTNFSGHEEHKEYFIQMIIEEFVRRQANYIAKKITLKEQGVMLRHKLKKIVHFKNQ